MPEEDPKLVAVVDDDAGVRTGLGRLLRSAGYSAAVFASGEEFLTSIGSNCPDCLILDLRMPGMDGFEIMTNLAAAGITLPVIVLTSFPSDEVRRRAKRAGALAFLEKPVERSVMIEALEGSFRLDNP
jgi:two-component system response regulator FixJ